jgi:CO/xanthine dehydrogenase FAD-binding subunit
MLLNPLTFHTPASLNEAVQLYTSLENVKLQAGGTFLLNSLKLLKRNGAKTPEHIISLRKIKELKGVSEDKNKLIIKAMTTISELSESPLLKDNLSVFKLVTKNISTQPIRNMATVGGNLTCRYTWTEMPAVMLGLGADLHFIGKGGREETMSAENFFKAAAKTDKIFTHLSVLKDPETSVAYQRVSKTPNVDIPLLSLLIKTTFNGGRFTDTRVGINNCVAFAQRDHRLEDFLNRSRRSEETVREALNHLDEPIYDTRSSDYKKHMFRICVKKALTDLINS